MAFAVDLTGTILDRRYRITGLLGKGGMGFVYEAVHLALDQRVAVKVLHPRYAYEERFRERFLQEARAASKIRHPNVVEIKDFGDTPDGSVYFAMEYLHGHDVGAELLQHATLTWPRTRSILLQAASALHAAHAKRIIHRDIKPGNCFLIEDEDAGTTDVVKLLDFGIAKVGTDSQADAQGKGLTGTGEVFGTASYMSPEQARGEVLDARSDMYSLGIMAYEMLVGQVPFIGVNAIHVITQHLTAKPEPLTTYDATIPAAVETVVMRMIAKATQDRYPSMAELEKALRAIPEDAGGRKTRLWSSPGELRALVEEKKGAAVRAPGEASPRAGGVAKSVVGAGAGARAVSVPRAPVVSGVVEGTDSERTEMVVPPAPKRSVKRRLLSVEPAGVAAAPGVAPVVAPAPAMPDAVAAPMAPAVRSTAVVPAASSAPPAHAPFAAPVTPVPPAPPAAAGSSYASGVSPLPEAQVLASSSPSWSRTGWSDGTNASPGRDEAVGSPATWQPSTSSTGPNMRLVDTGTDTYPHELEAGRAPGITLRMVLVVGVLVVLVGGVSVVGTMAVLSQRQQGKAGSGEVEPKKEEVEEPVPVGRPIEADEPPLKSAPDELWVEERAKEAVVVPDVGAPSVVPGPVVADGSDDVGVEDEVVEEPSEGAKSPEKPEVETVPVAPKVPKHETEKCVRAREAAARALDLLKFAEAAKLAKQRECWSAAQQVDRRRIQVNALLELGRFEECVAAGSKATDQATQKRTETCRKRLKKP